ncbi:MAG: DNA-3-methyladenine glycosylase [Acidobacteriaceae bacterium]
MPPTPLTPDFFLAPPDRVARRLLGKLLIRQPDKPSDEPTIGRIVEVEAYFGVNDPAAHAFAGKTARNAVLFGPPGRAYVYFIYGMHYCLNVSCEPEGHAGCVLIRALQPLAGLTTMARRRNLTPSAQPRLLASGPGRLCQALAITRAAHNGLDLTHPDSPLTLADDGFPPHPIDATPRIGIRHAADRPLRFTLRGNPFVSK